MFTLFFTYLLKTHRNTQKFKPQSITGQYYNIYIYFYTFCKSSYHTGSLVRQRVKGIISRTWLNMQITEASMHYKYNFSIFKNVCVSLPSSSASVATKTLSSLCFFIKLCIFLTAPLRLGTSSLWPQIKSFRRRWTPRYGPPLAEPGLAWGVIKNSTSLLKMLLNMENGHTHN